MKYLKKYSFLIGIIIFVILILRLDTAEIFNIISQANYFYFYIGCLLLIPLLFSKAYRWNYLKKKQGINYSLKDSFLIYNIGLYIGLFTPSRIGDLIKVVYLKQDKHSVGKSLANVILDRILDVVFLVAVGYLGMFFFLNIFQKQVVILSLIITTTVLFFFLILSFGKSNFSKNLLKRVFNFVIPERYQKSWKLGLQDFIKGIKLYSKKDYLYSFFITIVSWFIFYLMVYFLAKSINVYQVPFIYLIIAVTISNLLTILPISFLGIGTRDATFVLMFSLFGVSKELSLALALLLLTTSLLTIIIGLISWFIKPIKISGS